MIQQFGKKTKDTKIQKKTQHICCIPVGTAAIHQELHRELSLYSPRRKQPWGDRHRQVSTVGTWVWIRLSPLNHRICPRRSSISAWSISSAPSSSSSGISSLGMPWPASLRNLSLCVGTAVMSWEGNDRRGEGGEISQKQGHRLWWDPRVYRFVSFSIPSPSCHIFRTCEFL